MVAVLALLLLVVPFVELFIVVQVVQGFGFGPTIGALILISVAGAWLVKREGLGLLVRVQREVASGRVPGTALVDGFLVLFAGALLLTPGFLTDGVGLALLLPPVRAAIRVVLGRWFRKRALDVVDGGGAGRFAAGRFGSSRWAVYDVQSTPRPPDDEPQPPDARELDR